MRAKVIMLTPILAPSPVGTPWLTALAHAVTDSARGAMHVELISFAELARRETLQQNMSLRLLPFARKPEMPADVLSWEMPAALADADLVHIHHVFTRCGEMALLVAKQLHKPVCVSPGALSSSTLGVDLEILKLADRVVDLAELGVPVAAEETRPNEEDIRRAAVRLLGVYQSLLAETRAVAA
jgi:hypothetical protein